MPKITLSILLLLGYFSSFAQLPMNLNSRSKKDKDNTASPTLNLDSLVTTSGKNLNNLMREWNTQLKEAKSGGDQSTVDSLSDLIEQVKYKTDTFFVSQETWGITGIGNLADASQKNLNGSGAIQGFLRPLQLPRSQLQVDLSFIKNASNTDTLLGTTLLFPETGSNTFYGRVIWSWEFIKRERNKYNGYLNHHLLQPYFETYSKTIKQSKDSLSQFNTFSYNLGVNYSFIYKESDRKTIGFSIGPYISWTRIPENSEENYYKSYAANIDSTHTPTTKYNSWGVIAQLQVNDFSFYADFRDPTNHSTISKSLRGLQILIGVRFNANIF